MLSVGSCTCTGSKVFQSYPPVGLQDWRTLDYIGVMRNLEVDGAKLRTAREAAGMSVAALAKKARCSPWNIYRIENGNGQPSATVYGLIKKALPKNADLLAEQEEVA